MKTLACFVTTWVTATLLFAVPTRGLGAVQIFVANSRTGSVAEYSEAGELINPALITGHFEPEGIAVDGDGYLYVADGNGITKYTTSGVLVNSNGFEGVCAPWALALDGKGHVFVANYCGSIGEYTTSGDAVNASLISGLPYLTGLALDDTNLFVSIYGQPPDWVGAIGEFTVSGATINAALVPDLEWSWGLALDGAGHLFVANNTFGTITEYSTSGTNITSFSTDLVPTTIAFWTNGDLLVVSDGGVVAEYTTAGTLVNPSFISGPANSRGIALAIPPGPVAIDGGNRTVTKGSSTSLSATCSGTLPLKYEWFQNGHSIPGATNSSLVLPDISPSESGRYSVNVANAFGQATSPIVRLKVTKSH